MNDKRNEQHTGQTDEAPNSNKEQPQGSAWKRLLAKRWVFPATYMVAAAIILSLMWAYSGSDDQPLTEELDTGLSVTDSVNELDETWDQEQDSTPVQVAPQESLAWPVEDSASMIVLMPFYDENASAEEKAAAVIQQGNEYMAHMGISIGMEDQAPFDVLAAMSGTVTRIENLPMVGNQVEITHEDGLVTVYQSLENVSVSLNEQVSQGQVIAQAGRNELEKDLGVHLHFEVRENGEALNPQTLLPAIGTLVPNEDVDVSDGAVVEDGVEAESEQQHAEDAQDQDTDDQDKQDADKQDTEDSSEKNDSQQ